MKVVVALTLALALLAGSARAKEFAIDQIDEYLFAFFEGFELSKHYENSAICRSATADLTENFLSSITEIYGRDGEVQKAGLIAFGYSLSSLADFLRHCDATVAFIINTVSSFLAGFDDQKEFFDSFTENATINFMEIMANYNKFKTHLAEGDVNAMAAVAGEIAKLLLVFENKYDRRLLLAPLVARGETASEQDQFIKAVLFSVEALKSAQIIPKDEELQLCGDSAIAIDNKVTAGLQMMAEEGSRDGFYTVTDSLKHVGALLENCIDTWEDAVFNVIDKLNKVPDSTQLMMNMVGHISYIIRHLSRADASIILDDFTTAGQEFGKAIRYLFIEFDINGDFDDLP